MSFPTVVVQGTGSIGLRHVQAFRAVGIRTLALPVRAERADELSRQGLEVVRSMSEAAASGATAAVIATDTGRHVADALAAMDLGLDVLVEKPVAPTAQEASPLQDRARAAARRVFVAYCLRFHEGLALFRDLLRQIGEVHAVRIACQSFLPLWRPDRDYRASYSASAHEGGVLRDLSHEIDYALWLFGAPAGGVTAELTPGTRLAIAAESAADVGWLTAGGASVSLRLDYLTKRSRRAMLAQGSLGEIEWDAIGGTVRVDAANGTDVIRVPHDRDLMMQSQARAFLAATTMDSVGLLCTLEQAMTVVGVCDAARASSASGTRMIPKGERG